MCACVCVCVIIRGTEDVIIIYILFVQLYELLLLLCSLMTCFFNVFVLIHFVIA